MSLAGVWRRKLYAASGVALVVPAAIAGALAVLAWAGGFAGLGSLGQVFSGPTLSAAAHPRAHHGTPSVSLPRALGIAQAAGSRPAAGANGSLVASAGGPASAAPSGGSGSPGGGSGAGGSGGGHGSGGGGLGGGSGSGGSGSGGSGAGGGSGSPGPPGPGGQVPPPPPAPTIVDSAVNLATAVTAQVPGPLGSLGTQTLQSLGSTVDRVLPLRIPGGAPAPGESAASPVPAAQ